MEQQFTREENTDANYVAPQNSLADGQNLDQASAEQITPAEAAPLLMLLQQEAQSRRKEEWASLAWSSAFLLTMVWVATRTFPNAPSLMINLFLLFFLMVTVGAGMSMRLSRRSQRRKRSITTALAQIQTTQQIGPLIQALRVQNTPVRNLAKQALITLLPTMQASDAPLLGEAERSILLRQLSIQPNDPGYRDLKELFSPLAYRREVDLRLAILKALEQVGGAKELATVERLAQGLPTLQSAMKVPLEIREAAQACLPFLQVRAGEQHARKQLLRASVAPAVSDKTLLRPASARPEDHPEQLLRASETSS